MDVYADNILDHYRNPRSKEKLSNASVSHKEANVSCGDELTVELVITNGVIEKIGWNGVGCAISLASMSMLTEELERMKTDDAFGLSKDDIYEMLNVPIGPRRYKCALLCLHTLKNAILKEKDEEAQSWLKTVEVN